MPPGCGGGVANFCGKTAGIRPELRRVLSDKSRKPEFLPSGEGVRTEQQGNLAARI